MYDPTCTMCFFKGGDCGAVHQPEVVAQRVEVGRDVTAVVGTRTNPSQATRLMNLIEQSLADDPRVFQGVLPTVYHTLLPQGGLSAVFILQGIRVQIRIGD